MDIDELKHKLTNVDVTQCSRFLKKKFVEIRPLFYGKTHQELKRIRFSYEDVYCSFINSPTGKSLQSTTDQPVPITALLILFVSFFERCDNSYLMQSCAQYLPDGCIKKQVQSLFKFRHITNAETNFIERFKEIIETLTAAYMEAESNAEKQSCERILCEYALRATVETGRIGIDITSKISSLFTDIPPTSNPLIEAVLKNLNEIFDSNFRQREKMLGEERLRITALFHQVAYELCPDLFDGVEENSEEAIIQPQHFHIIPSPLDKILASMGAMYYPDHEKVKLGLSATDQRNKEYLGTYFPRTVIESWNIFYELFMHPEIKESFSVKKQIRILDIGSGTGGAVTGLLLALEKSGWGDNSCEVVIHSIDANSDALKKQKNIIRTLKDRFCFQITHHTKTHLFPHNLDNFVSEFQMFLQEMETEYFDLVLFWKCLCEFYNQNYATALGITQHAAQLIANHISDTGLCVLSDITTKINDIEFFPIILNRELEQYCTSSGKALKTVLPVPCSSAQCKSACYTQRRFRIQHKLCSSDTSKICYRVLAPVNFAGKITSGYLPKAHCMNAARPSVSCLNGKISEIEDNPPCGFTNFTQR